MSAFLAVCLYLGYVGDGYQVVFLTDTPLYILIHLQSHSGKPAPGDFFASLPYGSICELKLEKVAVQYNPGPAAGSGCGGEQNEYVFLEGSVLEDFQGEITPEGEVFFVYERAMGFRFQLNISQILGVPVVPGRDLVSAPEWYFLKLENFSELAEGQYAAFYAAWRQSYDLRQKKKAPHDKESGICYKEAWLQIKRVGLVG